MPASADYYVLIGTLMGFGTAKKGLVGGYHAQSGPYCAKRNSPVIILTDVPTL